MAIASALAGIGALAALIVSGCTDAGLAPNVDASVGTDASAADGQVANVDANVDAISLDQAFSCRSASGVGGIGKGTDLTRFVVDQSAFPKARCNDGTPAVFYYRPAATDVSRNKWVIQLNGGGGCRSGQACANRFCGFDTNFSAFQMSSKETPTGTHGEGILDRRSDNPWGDWNHVFVHFCTSDNWAGQAEGRVLSAVAPNAADAGVVSYRIDFLGAYVVDAVVATLRKAGGPAVSVAGVAAPDLDDASHVVLAGASAGGGGVARHADALGALLAQNRPTCGASPCALDFRALIDSSLAPSYDSYDLSASPLCTAMKLCSWEDIMRNEYTAGGFATWGARTDDSCLSWQKANAPGFEWRCADNDYLMAHHITTPMLVRMGQRDELHFRAVTEGNFQKKDGGGPVDEATFAALVRESLGGLTSLKSMANERSAIAVTPAVFGPSCTKHETLRNSEHVFDVRIPVDGKNVNMIDVWQAWLAGSTPTAAIAQPGVAGNCPK